VTGKATSQELHLDVSDFLPATLPNGGTAPMYDDRIIAHEMVHAVMGRTMNFASLPTWFKEGTAEFIHGADERLAGDIAANGGGAAGRNAVVNAIDAWASDSLHYSSGYAAAKYLDSKIGGGIKTVMTQLSANPTWNLDQAINAASGGTYATTAAFIADFKANGAAFIASLNLADADTGAVGGGTASSVVADLAGPATTDPLAGFVEEWPTVTAGTSSVTIQVGADAADTLDISLAAAGISDLGLSNVDIASQARQAIDQFDAAIKIVAQLRGNFGASMNRLEHVHNVTMTEYENLAASNSRIEDADVAQEVATLTRSQILLQASTSLIAQINQSPRSALTLLQAA